MEVARISDLLDLVVGVERRLPCVGIGVRSRRLRGWSLKIPLIRALGS